MTEDPISEAAGAAKEIAETVRAPMELGSDWFRALAMPVSEEIGLVLGDRFTR